MLDVFGRASNKLLPGQVFERFKRRRVDDFLQHAPYVGVIRRAAPDDETLEDAGMVRGCEKRPIDRPALLPLTPC